MTARETWAKRVERLKESDLTTAEFAAEIGVNASTLSHWKWRLSKPGGDPMKRTRRPRKKKKKRAPAAKATFVELTPPASSWWSRSERVEVVVDERHVIRVPDGFDPETLRQVLEVVEARS